MESKNDSSDGKKTKKSPVSELIKRIFHILAFTEVISELKTVNKRLVSIITIVGDNDGKYKKRNPFKIQLSRNKFIILALYIIPICFFIFVFKKFPALEIGEYLKEVLIRLVTSIKTKEFILDEVLIKDSISYVRARTWSIIFLFQIFFSHFLSKSILKHHFIISMTKKFKEETLNANFIKKDGKSEVLMTPAGLYIDLESSTEKSFMESESLWNQLNIYPGKVFNCKDSRTKIFATSIQPLKDSYEYFKSGSIKS